MALWPRRSLLPSEGPLPSFLPPFLQGCPGSRGRPPADQARRQSLGQRVGCGGWPEACQAPYQRGEEGWQCSADPSRAEVLLPLDQGAWRQLTGSLSLAWACKRPGFSRVSSGTPSGSQPEHRQSLSGLGARECPGHTASGLVETGQLLALGSSGGPGDGPGQEGWAELRPSQGVCCTSPTL